MAELFKRRAIRCTCSYCQHDSYFDASIGILLESISTSTCARCGRSGAVITLNVEPLTDVTRTDRHAGMARPA
jgi:hypothetical protein